MRLPGWLRRQEDEKGDAEFAYWTERKETAGPLEEGAHHYRSIFTDQFGLDYEFFAGKRMLDIGCGPRGSLTWAGNATERVGLDPLVARYATLQQGDHGMDYVESGAEQIPFPDGHFDVVSTINSLDHVESVEGAIAEITRVTRSGGSLLLLVDVGHDPTPTEPHRLDWDLPEQFGDDWQLVHRRDLERPSDNMLDNLWANQPFNHDDPARRPGVLLARMQRA